MLTDVLIVQLQYQLHNNGGCQGMSHYGKIGTILCLDLDFYSCLYALTIKKHVTLNLKKIKEKKASITGSTRNKGK